ncbi:hypothetical protein [Metabacillus litoralis]|nr:hypothetical protein [Metabacillus litoralis]
MKLNIDINEKYEETYVTIHSKVWTKEVFKCIAEEMNNSMKKP